MSAHLPFVPVPVPERFLGQTVGGRYRLTRLLGTGAYAWVYEAVDTELEITVAVKVLRPEHTGNEVSEARFRREATTAAKLRHPNIVTVRDVGKGDGVTWVAMDLVPMSLSRRLEIMPFLPETDVVRVGLDVAAALSVAHAAEIIHRDIKPDNILIGASGESIVCDFGLARALTGGADLSATNQVLGTPHYFSPEQARGEPLDGRSDLYALGVTLYRAATGRLPFEGDDWYAVARQHVDVPPPPPRKHVEHLSKGFESVLLRLLSKKPSERFANATALADALMRLPTAPATGSRLALTPGGTTTTHTVGRTERPWRVPAIIGGVAVLALAVIGLMQARPLAIAGPSTPAVPDSAAMAADSAARADSLLAAALPADSLTDTTSNTNDTPVVAPPTARFAAIELSAAESSTLFYVNGELMASGSWRNARAAPGKYVVRAVLPDGPGVFAGCPYNERNDTITVRAGGTIKRSASLARCTRVWLDVVPRDARVSFVDAEGDVVIKGNASALSPQIVRAGAWRLVAEAPRCFAYDAVDTLAAGADTVRIRMAC